jgi:hypothetical protein
LLAAEMGLDSTIEVVHTWSLCSGSPGKT